MLSMSYDITLFWNLLLYLVIDHVTMPPLVTDVTVWPIDPNPSCSKNRKIKEKQKQNKIKNEEWK